MKSRAWVWPVLILFPDVQHFFSFPRFYFGLRISLTSKNCLYFGFFSKYALNIKWETNEQRRWQWGINKNARGECSSWLEGNTGESPIAVDQENAVSHFWPIREETFQQLELSKNQSCEMFARISSAPINPIFLWSSLRFTSFTLLLNGSSLLGTPPF